MKVPPFSSETKFVPIDFCKQITESCRTLRVDQSATRILRRYFHRGRYLKAVIENYKLTAAFSVMIYTLCVYYTYSYTAFILQKSCEWAAGQRKVAN